jgi:hypothetical protein
VNKRRLERLEAAARERGDRDAGSGPEPAPLSDEQEADQAGEGLWEGFLIAARYPSPWSSPDDPCDYKRGRGSVPDYLQDWYEATLAAWNDGIREYPAERLRPFAAAVWAAWGPQIRRERQRQARWVPDELPTEEATPFEAFRAELLAERVESARQREEGHRSNRSRRSAR